jgi:hypothetical protein
VSGRYLTSDATVSAHGAYAVTPADNTDLTNGVTRGLYIGATGNLSVVMADGMTVTFSSVPVGILPVQVIRVRSSSTTASSILALY